ncbi:hypothetical protein [Cellulophaga sp. L1A9]|uniref:hypothetical protein n=1 Tax=Cellulophaga sp. L1A9 TaxID=2686362 RepID=UPI00131C9D60|nr:hypothetical protein [Cellulophaga sp. L1A9]
MRKTNYILGLFCGSILAVSCSSDSVSEEFDEANGDVVQKLIKTVALTSGETGEDEGMLEFSYTADGALSSVSNGEGSSDFLYDGDELTNVTGDEDTSLSIEKLYESPYDAFETGNVLEYDANGNPKIIEFFEEEYDWETDSYLSYVYTAEVTYDEAQNPFFYTLEAGGIIDVLDGVQLNFSMNPQATEIIKARMLFPVNNLSKIVYKNEEGEIEYTMTANYVYDADNYATSGVISSAANGEVDGSFTVQFTYVE